MARGRKPQLSLDDLEKYARAIFGSPMEPTTNASDAWGHAVNSTLIKYFDPRDFGKPNRLVTDVYDYANPLPFFTAEETRRLGENKRPDKGHLATAALLAAFIKGPKMVRSLGRGAKALFEGTPRGTRTQPVRTATANMGGTANDPMALYAAYLAATNRR